MRRISAGVLLLVLGWSGGSALGDTAPETRDSVSRFSDEAVRKAASLQDLADAYRQTVKEMNAAERNHADWQVFDKLRDQATAICRELAERGKTLRTQRPDIIEKISAAKDEEIAAMASELSFARDEYRFRESEADAASEAKRRAAVMTEAIKRIGWEEVIAQWEWPDLKEIGDDRLKVLWETAKVMRRGFEEWSNKERIMNEMVRRGGKVWEDALAAELDRLAKAPGENDRILGVGDLEVLTAFRRIQKKGDPVVVELKQKSVESVFPQLPTVDAELVNVDPEKRTVHLQIGGDYRSGRPVRWRMEATDAQGKVVGWREWEGMMGGGLFSAGDLKFGDREKMGLEAGSFLPMLLPGKYTLRVYYHNQITIAEQKSVDGLVMCGSAPIPLTVKPLIVTGGPEAVKKVTGLVAELDGKAPVQLIAGTYGEWAAKHVDPESAQGKILSMGMEALPGLLAALEDAKLDEVRRAEVLGMLFSLTGQNDPRKGDGVLPAYHAWIGPWSVMGKNGGGFSLGGEESMDGGKIDAVKQKDFALKWKAWKDYVKVGV